MLENIIDEAVEVFEDERKEGYLQELEEVRRFGYESAEIYISRLSVEEEWELIEELNQKEQVAEFGINPGNKTLGQAISEYVESTLAELITRATIDSYYNKYRD